MRDGGGVLNRWKERAVFMLLAAALVAYAARLARAPASEVAGAAARERDEKDQSYLRGSGGLALPADAAAVFAAAEPEAYFDAELRRVWVEPKAEVVRTVLHLGPPPPTVPAPPMLLPVPGPMLGFTSRLLRWPQMPVVAEEGEGPAKTKAALEEKPAAPRRSRGGPRRPPARPKLEDRPARRKPASDEKARGGGGERRKRPRRPRDGRRRERPGEEESE